MPLNITVENKQEGVYVVIPEGHLDSTTSFMFEEEVTPLFAATTKVLMFDLSKLDYISSAGVRFVFMAQKAMSKYNGVFMMTNLRPQIKKVFEIINALPSLRVFKNIEEADEYLYAMQEKEIEKQEV
ncbi:MAG: STAS domain-containing protein [Desulfobacterales bacterium]|nr:STAS domain-containing protein [Desulfobacterales bacterium]